MQAKERQNVFDIFPNFKKSKFLIFFLEQKTQKGEFPGFFKNFFPTWFVISNVVNIDITRILYPRSERVNSAA